MFKKRNHTQLFRFVFLTAIIGFIIPSIAMLPKSKSSGTVNRVVIDAGHGGKDYGNLGTGRYKSKEKHISLEVALQFGNYIKQNMPEVEVIYTRDNDEFVGLKERAAMANKAQADLFISIHCNAHTAGNAYGTETFVMGLSREKANLEISRRENSVIFLEEDYEKTYEGYDPNDPQGAIIASLTSNAYLGQSALLAQKVQDQFRERVKRHDRGVKQSVLYVLDFSAMPSILIELGFLTNKNEEDFLNTSNGKELMASAIYRAFKEYKTELDEMDKLNNNPAVDTEIKDQIKPVEPAKPPVNTTEKDVTPTTNTEIKSSEWPVYKVQLAASTKKMPLVSSNFNGLEGVEMYEEKPFYKYTMGNFKSLEEAKNFLPMVKSKGYKDAYVIAFYKGERIDVNKAAEIHP
jgi:N-acetylmuramoyl-L-alanine amidase